MYILQWYYWDGDSYLVSTFKGVFDSIENIPKEIKEFIPKKYNRRQQKKSEESESWKGFYIPNEPLPKWEDGGYGSTGFYVLENLEINKLIVELN